MKFNSLAPRMLGGSEDVKESGDGGGPRGADLEAGVVEEGAVLLFPSRSVSGRLAPGGAEHAERGQPKPRCV